MTADFWIFLCVAALCLYGVWSILDRIEDVLDSRAKRAQRQQALIDQRRRLDDAVDSPWRLDGTRKLPKPMYPFAAEQEAVRRLRRIH